MSIGDFVQNKISFGIHRLVSSFAGSREWTRVSEFRLIGMKAGIEYSELKNFIINEVVGETPLGDPFLFVREAAKYYKWYCHEVNITLGDFTNHVSFSTIDINNAEVEVQQNNPVVVHFNGYIFIVGRSVGNELAPVRSNSIIAYHQNTPVTVIEEFYSKLIEYLIYDYKTKSYFKVFGGSSVEKKVCSLDEVFLPEDLKVNVVHSMESFFESEMIAKFVRNNEPSKRAMLLDGDPGLGKTLLVNALANHMNLPLVGLSLAEANSHTLDNAFLLVKMLAPAIMVIDDFTNSMKRAGQYHVDSMLRILGGIYQWPIDKGIYIIATGNLLSGEASKLRDDPLFREGRFDDIIRIYYDEEQAKKYYNYLIDQYEIMDPPEFPGGFVRMTEVKDFVIKLAMGCEGVIDFSGQKQRRLGFVQ